MSERGLLELEKIQGASMENFCVRKAHTDSRTSTSKRDDVEIIWVVYKIMSGLIGVGQKWTVHHLFKYKNDRPLDKASESYVQMSKRRLFFK